MRAPPDREGACEQRPSRSREPQPATASVRGVDHDRNEIAPLQRRDLFTVMVDDEDRRGRRLRLTPAGRALLARALPVWRRMHAKIDRLLLPDGAGRLRRDLQALS